MEFSLFVPDFIVMWDEHLKEDWSQIETVLENKRVDGRVTWPLRGGVILSNSHTACTNTACLPKNRAASS